MKEKRSADHAGWRDAQGASLGEDFKAAREPHRQTP